MMTGVGERVYSLVMPKTKRLPRRRAVSAAPKTVRIPLTALKQMIDAGGPLADLAEEILEREGLYSDEFLASLREAEEDVRAGRVYTAASIDDLLRQKD